MTHDIQDLLDLIKQLEERILLLEKLNTLQASSSRSGVDAWYWDH